MQWNQNKGKLALEKIQECAFYKLQTGEQFPRLSNVEHEISIYTYHSKYINELFILGNLCFKNIQFYRLK